MLKLDATLESFFQMSPNELSRTLNLPHSRAVDMYQCLHEEAKWEVFENNLKHVHVVTIVDQQYPASLRNISVRPYFFYGLGDTAFLPKIPSLRVGGTAIPSPMSHKKIHYVGRPS